MIAGKGKVLYTFSKLLLVYKHVKHRNEETEHPRRRLSREERHRQLMAVAWRLVREEGTDALTLGRLAEQAGITKPVVYDHFGTRTGLLTALYREFDDRQTALLQAALRTGEPTLAGRAAVIASAYLDCVLAQGREIPGVVAALTSSPELERIKRDCDAAFREMPRRARALRRGRRHRPRRPLGDARRRRGPVHRRGERRPHRRRGAGGIGRDHRRDGQP